MAAPMYNPPVPCIAPITGGLGPGRMVRVQGSLTSGAQNFAINLQCGPNTEGRDDIALHINPRFPEMCVVRNHLSSMVWGTEEREGGMPFVRGDPFEVMILCDTQGMKIAVNGAHFADFTHRISHQRISHILVEGECKLSLISFEGATGGGPAAQGFGAPPPGFAPVYGGGGGYADYQYY